MMNNTRFSPDGPAAKWSWHYRTLRRLRAALTHAQNARNAALRAVHGDGPRDATDVAGDLQDQDELLAALAFESVEVSEIDAALERLRDGTYGICEETGKPIPERRLRAIPWTRFTQPVAALRENHIY